MSLLGPRPLLGTSVHLIIDHRDLRDVLVAILEFCGASVFASPSGAHAREVVEHGRKPAAILLDTCTVGLDAGFWTWADDHGLALVAFTVRASDPHREPTWLRAFPAARLDSMDPEVICKKVCEAMLNR